MDEQVRAAIAQWRDALVSLGNSNRLISYRPTRSSTLEFTRHDSQAVYDMIFSPAVTYVMGTKPPEKPKESAEVEPGEGDAEGEDLEEAVLSQIEEFDFDEFPDHLFVDKTQRDVDKALRNLSATAKREFIEKGLRVLYLAVGELRWVDDAGDARRSPLLLFPADLVTPGPRERLYIEFSDDDPAVNPALALKLLDEYGLSLPTLEEVVGLLDSDGVTAALDLFRRLDLPEGWEVVDGAVLSVFMFAKEAMYRDLLDNEERVAGSITIQALSGGLPLEGSGLLFEPHSEEVIDDVAPPEVAPLVLDADASQRAAVQAALEGYSFTLDGPPGTGKSQTIANVIASLISEGKTVLFVSEKAVALDVVRDRLAARGLDPFLFELHSNKAARKEVASRLGTALATRPVPPTPMSDVRIQQLRAAREALTTYVVAANEKRVPLGHSVHEVIGWLENLGPTLTGPALNGDIGALSAESLAQLQATILRASRTWPLRLEGRDGLWFGLLSAADLQFPISQASFRLEELHHLARLTAKVRNALDLGRVSDLPAVEAVLGVWEEMPEYHDEPWLTVASFDKLLGTFRSYADAVTQRAAQQESLEKLTGSKWAVLPSPDAQVLLTLQAGAKESWWLGEEQASGWLRAAISSAEQTLQSVVALKESSELFARLVGAKSPMNPNGAIALFDAGRALLSSDGIELDWLYVSGKLSRARNIAAQCKHLEQDLNSAAQAATPVFTRSALEQDLAQLVALVAETKGLAKRFSSQHRTLRSRLAGISSVKWNIARDALPAAVRWQEAHRAYNVAAAEASSTLGKSFQVEGGTDWASIERALDLAETALGANLHARVATETFLASPERRTSAQGSLVDLEQLITNWREAPWAMPADVDLSDQGFGYLGQRLTREISLLRAAVAIVTSQEELVPEGTTVGSHIEIANARFSFDMSDSEARIARDQLEALVGADPETLGLELPDVDRVKRHVEWVQRVQVAARIRGERGLSASQVEVLRSAAPVNGVGETLDRYQQSVAAILRAFGSERLDDLRDDLDDFDVARELLDDMNSRIEEADDWIDLKTSSDEAERLGLAPAIKHAIEHKLDSEKVGPFLLATVYRTWINVQLLEDSRFVQTDSASRDDLIARFRELDAELVKAAVSRVIEVAAARRPRTALGQGSLIRREAEKKRRHIPVRDLIAQTREVIQALHPCFMMSPLAVSQYLPPEEMFDVVIFDEASQVLPADAINCIYRARAVITAGDQKQLPPTSFFDAVSDASDDEEEEDLAKDYESILDLMKSSGHFTAQSLRWHYRSRHEHLISYSNASFYESRLITFPSAVEQSDDFGVKFFKVPGVYRRSAGQDNPIEARHVAERVIHHFDVRPDKTLGVVAFSAKQRDAIEAAVELARGDRPDLDAYFTEERGTGFFVKSLESVQGDERDVIIFSIGYGPDEHGRVYRNFGPVARSGGQRRLNVAITRAKELVEVVSSMSASDIGEVASEGGRHLRRYLDFAERGPAALEIELGSEGRGTDSPFEDAVLDYVRSLGYEVQPQVGVAGYRIDLGVKHPNQPGAFMLGIECDGAAYHSSKAARDRDRIRHEILEGLGWQIHHIWGTAWYRHAQREKERLRLLLEELASKPMTGRVSRSPSEAPVVAAPITDVVSEVTDFEPDWVADYAVARVERIPSYLDLSDSGNGRRLRHFVDAVAAVEAPVHIDVLAQRLREHSQYDRIGAKIRQTLLRAIRLANVDFDGEFVRTPGPAKRPVRRGTIAFSRTVTQVPEEELRRAVTLLVRDAVSVSRAQLVSATASVFGWKRVGADIRDRTDASIAALLEEDVLAESSAGLSLRSAAD